jgi:hypothetical protein
MTNDIARLKADLDYLLSLQRAQIARADQLIGELKAARTESADLNKRLCIVIEDRARLIRLLLEIGALGDQLEGATWLRIRDLVAQALDPAGKD